MRRGCALALMFCTIGFLTLGSRAEAGVSYDFVFRPGGGGFANGNQYTFPGPLAASGGEAVADVILRTGDALIANSINDILDDSEGHAVVGVAGGGDAVSAGRGAAGGSRAEESRAA